MSFAPRRWTPRRRVMDLNERNLKIILALADGRPRSFASDAWVVRILDMVGIPYERRGGRLYVPEHDRFLVFYRQVRPGLHRVLVGAEL